MAPLPLIFLFSPHILQRVELLSISPLSARPAHNILINLVRLTRLPANAGGGSAALFSPPGHRRGRRTGGVGSLYNYSNSHGHGLWLTADNRDFTQVVLDDFGVISQFQILLTKTFFRIWNRFNVFINILAVFDVMVTVALPPSLLCRPDRSQEGLGQSGDGFLEDFECARRSSRLAIGRRAGREEAMNRATDLVVSRDERYEERR